MPDFSKADRERMGALAHELDAMAASAEVLAQTRHCEDATASAQWWFNTASSLRESASHVRAEMLARASTEVV